MQKEINYILNKGKSNNATASEEKEMCVLFHQAEYEYDLKGQLLIELQNTEIKESSTPFFKKLFNKIWSKIEMRKNEPKSKIKLFSTFNKIAAIIIIGLFAGFYFTTFNKSHDPIYYAAHSPEGSVSEILLPDSSIIFLNAGTKIKYSFDGDNGIREVFLNGEAWFDVHKNKKKPFIVHTLYYDINVTGTQFNVSAYETDTKISTTLEEGEIIINSTEGFKIEEAITLVPGEQIVLDKETAQLTIKTVNTARYSSWKDNKLIFVNMSLQELIILLERKFGVDIEVKNDRLLGLHFDGTIKNETIIEILEIIKKTLPVKYKIIDQKIEITAI